ncbi:PEP-CTERM sorting domain-containing protein [Candidatus Binatus sp.]|uniref:PEP-CTERM sorting domain-containing protein n=1 Tax=Candidatus Binatus sp. TaxID=2811406 RepID=UPI003CC645F9
MRAGGLALEYWKNVGGNVFTGSIGGSTIEPPYAPSPEPGTLGLLATGLVGLVGVVKHKLKV